MIRREELIKIGQFNKPHGLNGEISFSFTDDVFDRTDCPYIVCLIDGIFVPFFIDEYRFRSENGALVKLSEINSAEDAKMFTNLEVYFPKEFIPKGEEMDGGKDFFLNYTVVDKNRGKLGTVTNIDDSTANVLFEIDYDGETLLIPAVDEFVEKVDEKSKTIYMNIPEGLFEI